MMNKTAFLVVSILCILGVYLFEQNRHKSNSPAFTEDGQSQIIANVNGHKLTRVDLEQKIQQIKGNTTDTKDVEKMATQLLIEETLLLQKAMAMKINENQDFLNNIENFWKQSLVQELFKRQMSTFEKQYALDENIIHQHQILTQSQFLCIFLDSNGKSEADLIHLSEADITAMIAKESKPLTWVSYLDLPTDLRWQLLKDPKRQVIVSDSNSAVTDKKLFLWRECKISEEGLGRDKSIELMKEDFIQTQMRQWVDQLHKEAEIKLYDAHLAE